MLIISPVGFLSEATVGHEGALAVSPARPALSRAQGASWTHPEVPFVMSAKFILSVIRNRAYFKLKVQCIVFVEGRKDGWIITLWFSCVLLFHGLQEVFFFPLLAVCPEWQKYTVRWLNKKKCCFKILAFWNHFHARVPVFPAGVDFSDYTARRKG